MTTHAWVVGASGLLGGALASAIAQRPGWTLFDAAPLPWGDPDAIRIRAIATTAALIAEAEADGSDWALLWAAGAATTSATANQLELELRQLTEALAGIEHASAGRRAGRFFLASSAGGVYGGSANPPFDEFTDPVPISAYGQFKLDAEQAVTDFAERSGCAALIGRITNLYGPGQKLEKMQGLISQLLVASYSRKPINIFVPLETVRDFFFADDCAELVLSALERVGFDQRNGSRRSAVTVKVLGSGQDLSISALLGYFRAIFKSPVRVILGSSPASRSQAVALRVRSVVWTDLDHTDKTPLAAGIHSTAIGILETLQR